MGCGPKEIIEEEVYLTKEDKIYQKLWKSKIIFNEPCLLVEDYHGDKSAILLHPAVEIIEVKNYQQTKTYDPSEYVFEGDYIAASENSTMPYLTERNVQGYDIPNGIDFLETSHMDSGRVLFTESPNLSKYLINVTYKTKENWQYEKPVSKGEKLPIFQQKLESKKDINLLVNGDSIFTGASSTGKLNIEPYQDPFPVAFPKEIKRKYNTNVVTTNTSVGGKDSIWGKENVNENIVKYNPDIVLLGFGMNDYVSADKYKENIKSIIDTVRANKNDTEFILAATIVANPDWSPNENRFLYLDKLLELENELPGVGVLDMTTYSNNLLKKKISFELYNNNVNHPNDFLTRNYVTNLMTLIEK